MLLCPNISTVKLWGRNTRGMEKMAQQRCNRQYLPGVSFPPNIKIRTDFDALVDDNLSFLVVVPSHARASDTDDPVHATRAQWARQAGAGDEACQGDATQRAPPNEWAAAPSADEALLDEERQEKLVEAILQLPDQQQKVLNLYYYEELTLKEIGAVLEVTESRICQVHTAAIKRLRKAMRGDA